MKLIKDDLNEVMNMLMDAHALLSKTSLPQVEYQPISTNLNLAKLKLLAMTNALPPTCELKKRTSKELKQSRCKAYKYLLP